MKAALCRSLDGPDAVHIEEIAEPVPGHGEVVVSVKAAALNFFDTLMVRGRYQNKPSLPFSPGAEIAGIVDAVGDGVTGWKPGDRALACIRWNGCRERTIAKAHDLVPLPDAIGDDIAAGLSVTYGTAVHALYDRARLKPGETIAVLGAAGGAGLAAVDIAHLLGARVIAVASSAAKLALAREHGADEGLDYTTADLKEGLRSLTGGKGADVVYDCVGGPHTEAALRATAWNGRLLIVGFAAGDIPKVPMNIVLLRNVSIVGVTWGAWAQRNPEQNRAHIERVIGWVAEGRLKPHVGAVYSLEETADAIRALDERRARGKVIVRP